MELPQNISDALERVPPKARDVYAVFLEKGAMTDDELVVKSGIRKGTASPRRNDLVRAGLLEPVGSAETASGGTAKLWGLVPAERVEEMRAIAARQGPRRKAIGDYPLDHRVELLRLLLAMDDVHRAVQSKDGRAWSRARGRVQDEKSSRERQRRENAADLREAERRGSPTAEYYKLRRALIESGDRTRAVRRLVEEELDRQNDPEGAVIPVDAWSDVASLLDDLVRDAQECGDLIREVMGTVGDDIIEGTVIEDEDFIELIEGDSDAATAA